MSSSLGSLVVELSANMAQFQSDMGKAAHIAQENMAKVNEAVDIAKKGLVLLGMTAVADSFMESMKSTIDYADKLSLMSQSAGVSVESLSALNYSAKLNGVSLEQLSGGLVKLSKNMLSVEQGTGNAVQAIDGLGVKAKGGAAAAFDILNIKIEASKGHLKSSEQIMYEVADRFHAMQDGTTKTALATQIFGKTGADLIPILNGGSAAIKANSEELKKMGGIISTDMAADANQFNDNIDKMNTATQGLKLAILNNISKPLVDISNAMVEAAKDSGTLMALWVGMGGVAAHAFGLDEASKAQAKIDELKHSIEVAQKQFDAGTFAPKNTNDHFFKFLVPDVKLGEEALSKLGQRLTIMRMELSNLTPDSVVKPPKKDDAETDEQKRQACLITSGIWDAKSKTCKTRPATSSADDPSKALLANALKMDEAAISQQADILASRNKMIDQYNSDNLISIKDYYAAKKAAQDENISATLALYDKEITALKAHSANAKKATDKAEDTGKINELLAKKSKLEQSAAEAALYAGMQESKAMKTLADQLGTVNAQVLELTGHLHEAAVIRFDQQNQSLKDRFSAEGNANALAQLETLKKYSIAQADLNKITEDSNLIKNAAANAEARINIAQKAGALSELGTLSALSKVRMDEAAQLEGLYKQYKKIADESGNKKLIQDADDVKLALEKLKSESDLVGQRIQSVFTNNFANAFTEFLSGTKSASDAFKSFASGVIQELLRIEAQKLALKLFAGMDGSGAGGSGLWGSAMSAIGGLFKADGGNVNNNSPYIVGEAGPELFVPGASGTIIPNHALANQRSNSGSEAGHTYITVHVNGSNNAPDVRRSAGQGAREALAALSGAQRYA
jgi:hypothetical protein